MGEKKKQFCGYVRRENSRCLLGKRKVTKTREVPSSLAASAHRKDVPGVAERQEIPREMGDGIDSSTTHARIAGTCWTQNTSQDQGRRF